MNEDAALYALLALGIALVILGVTGRGGVMLAALLAPQALQETPA